MVKVARISTGVVLDGTSRWGLCSKAGKVWLTFTVSRDENPKLPPEP